MEEISVLRRSAQLVVDESRLKGLLRCDDKNGLHGTGTDTAEEVVGTSALSQDVLLNITVRAEPDVVLGDGEQQESAVALVEAEEAVGSHGFLHGADHTLRVLLLEELHHGLSVLGRVGA